MKKFCSFPEIGPVGKHFGNLGVGEGIVFTYLDEIGNKYRFKSKGLKHSNSKVKTLASVNTEITKIYTNISNN